MNLAPLIWLNGFWVTRPTRLTTSASVEFGTLMPSTTTDPLRSPPSECGMNPEMVFARVVLPTPEAPTTPTTCPASTVRSMPASTSVSVSG